MSTKQNQHRITVAEMAPHIHSFLPAENKVDKLVAWLKNWIDLSLECGKIKPYDFLPLKGDLACHIGVSIGTVQAVFRRVEDEGYIESKQRIGSYISDRKKENSLQKLTSKRDLAVEVIKKYILEEGYKIGDKLISSRKFAEITGFSNTIVNNAFKTLTNEGVLDKKDRFFVIQNLSFDVEKIQQKTLVEKIADKIRVYVEKNLKSGDKLPSNEELVKMLKVSAKTIHDSIKLLSKEGLLYTRRGKYGTIVLGSDNEEVAEVYEYEKFEQKIKNYMMSDFQVGDKLPPIRELAKVYQTSEKTIKKALDNLAEEGYLTFSRGRYGGTFILDLPQESGEAYKWLAISTDYMSN